MVSANSKDFFDAVILDINMPIMDGYEACRLINNYLNGNTPILAEKEHLNHGFSKQKKALIYSLTSDFSEFTKKRLK